MSFESILHQPLAVQLLQLWLAKKTTQPLLLFGPQGTGKRALALEAAKALNCKSSPGVVGCGACVSCKKIAGGNHPDVRVLDMAHQALVRGEPLEKQQSLRIETVLEERKRLYQTPNEGSWKVSFIDDAHRMTPDAANVLLKVMEEPPPNTAIFLSTPYRDRLFATLISRCQPVRFQPLAEAEKQRRLTAEERGEISAAETLWTQLPSMTVNQILSASEPRSRTTAAAARADIEAHLLALLTPALKELRAGRPYAAANVERIQKAHQQLRHNVTPNLVYDNLLLQLSGASKR